MLVQNTGSTCLKRLCLSSRNSPWLISIYI
jgi:hypothetical protein